MDCSLLVGVVGLAMLKSAVSALPIAAVIHVVDMGLSAWQARPPSLMSAFVACLGRSRAARTSDRSIDS